MTVAVDANGASVHDTGPREWEKRIRSGSFKIPVAASGRESAPESSGERPDARLDPASARAGPCELGAGSHTRPDPAGDGRAANAAVSAPVITRVRSDPCRARGEDLGSSAARAALQRERARSAAVGSRRYDDSRADRGRRLHEARRSGTSLPRAARADRAGADALSRRGSVDIAEVAASPPAAPTARSPRRRARRRAPRARHWLDGFAACCRARPRAAGAMAQLSTSAAAPCDVAAGS